MNRAVHGWERDGGLMAVEGGERACERHLALAKAMAGAETVAAADGVPAVPNLMIGGKATETAVGVGGGLWDFGSRGFWGSRGENGFEVGFGTLRWVIFQQLTREH
jgi:hypothetical protein